MSNHQSPVERFKRPTGGLIDYAIKAGRCIHGSEPEICKTCQRRLLTNRDEKRNVINEMHPLRKYEHDLAKLAKEAETSSPFDLPILRRRYRAVQIARDIYLKKHGLVRAEKQPA